MMDELIARLEKATGQDRDLDARIAYAVKPALARCGTLEEWLQTSASKKVLTYTWSIDDALTLVPDKLRWSLVGSGKGADMATVSDSYPVGNHYFGDGPTAALALCIAALKARAAAP